MHSLRHKLWLGFGGLLLLLAVVSLLSAVVLTRYSHTLQRAFHDNYNSAVFAGEMITAIDQLNRRQELLIWNNPAAAGIDPASQVQTFQDNLDRQSNNITLPGERELTAQVAGLWANYQSAAANFESANPAARPALYREQLLPLDEQIQSAAQKIGDINMHNMSSADDRTRATLVDARNALMFLVINGTLLAALLVWAIGAAILRSLQALTHSARQIEAGNLDTPVPVRSRDEIGQLAQAFNSMAARLREIRRLDHDRLVRTQQTTQLAIDSLPDAVFVIGPAGEIEISNRIARAHLGAAPGITVVGLNLKWLSALYDEIRKTAKPVEPRGYQTAIQLFQGNDERFLLPHAAPMVSDSGQVVGVTVILVDVTRLRSADEAKSDLVSTVSHELRTPLTSIRMALGLLTGGKFNDSPPKQAALLDAARQDSERLYRTVENLLSMSRMESGRAPFDLQRLPAAQIVAAAVDPLRSALAAKPLSLEVSLPPNLPDVLADPAAISPALTNLLSNALKYTPAGGHVRVTAAADNGKWVRFEVSDTGPGVPPEFAARVFEKFFRAPQPQGPSGAGLGLAIAKEVVEAHGGSIELSNRPGPGSTFRFTLRQADAGQSPQPLAASG